MVWNQTVKQCGVCFLPVFNELKYAINASKQQMSRNILLTLASVQAEGSEGTAKEWRLLPLTIKLVEEEKKNTEISERAEMFKIKSNNIRE